MTGGVRPKPPWTERLTGFIERELQLRGEIVVERVIGGQSNPTWFVDVGARRLVLRMQPPGELLPSAHALDREFRVLRALEGTRVPVPRVFSYSEDRSIVGTPFYVMERVDGRIFHRAVLDGVAPAQRRAMYRSAAATLAYVHAVDWKAAGLSDFGKHADYFGRQVRRWTRQWEASRHREIPDLERLVAWLPSHVPEQRDTVICHGDYRFGNLIFAPSSADIVGVLDWELSTLGDPLSDLGYLCMYYHTSVDHDGVADADRSALGIPSEDELVADYNAACGTRRELLPFHVAFAFFRFAVIFAGIEDRVLKGNAAHPDAARVVGKADGMADAACRLLGI